MPIVDPFDLPQGTTSVGNIVDPLDVPVSATERMVGFGSPVARFVKGFIADPLLGVNQAVGQAMGSIGEGVEKVTGPNILTTGLKDIAKQSSGVVKQYEQATEFGRKRVGSEGIDLLQLGGAIVSPVNKLLGPASAETALGRVGENVITGGLFGAIQPVKEDDYISEKIKQIGAGAFFGGLVSGGVETASKVGTLLKDLAQPLTEKGQSEVLRKYLDSLTGTKKTEIVTALKTADELVAGSRPTASQALANIPEATSLAAFESKVAGAPQKGIAPLFAARAAEQEAARAAELSKVAQTPQALAAAEAQRTALTAPIRDEALAQANIAGQVIPRLEDEIASKFAEKTQALRIGGKLGTEASQQANLLKTQPFYPVAGMPRVPTSYRPQEQYAQVEANLAGAREAGDMASLRQAQKEFKQMQLDSLSQNGFYPLESQPIITKINSVLNEPGKRASTLVQAALTDVKSKLQGLTNERGVIDSRDLYTIRKEIGTTISKFAKETGNWDQKLVASLDTNLKSYIDNSIVKAGGTNWKEYLTTYQKASDKINQIQIGQALEKQLGTPLGNKERAGVFATAIENAAQTIKKSTGQARFQKLEDVMTKPQIESINSVLADLQRTAKAETLAGKSGATGLTGTGELPNFLNRAASITNTILRSLKKDSNEKINRMAADLLLDPPKLAAFIEGIPPNKMQNVISGFMSRLTPEMRQEFLQRATIRGLTEATTQ